MDRLNINPKIRQRRSSSSRANLVLAAISFLLPDIVAAFFLPRQSTPRQLTNSGFPIEALTVSLWLTVG
jgi:hypothetical protein